jgi:hypothetical protein
MDKETRAIYAELSKPFGKGAVKSPPKGKYGNYVEHSMVRQKMIALFGNFDESIPYHLKETLTNPKTQETKQVLVGCTYRLTVEINGVKVTKESTGVCEHPFNWNSDAERLKVAEADGFKRVCMKLGVALHLYANEDFILHDILKSDEQVSSDTEEE